MKRLLVLPLLLALLLAGTAAAAGIAGKWKGKADTPAGPVERTFVFKVDGNKVTGETTSSMLGKSTITDGKVEGDKVTFSITAKLGDNEMKIDYKGTISGDQIKLTSSTAANGAQGIEWVAKRQ